MVLIICPNCGSSISDRALSCPKCGKSQIPKKIGFLKAYSRFCSKAFNIKPLFSKREYWFGFLFSQIINLALLIIGTTLPDIFVFPLVAHGPLSSFNTVTLPDIFGVPFAVHFLFSSFALLTLSIRRIRGGGKSGFWGIFYLIFIYSYIIILA